MKRIATVLSICLMTCYSHAVFRTWVGGGGNNNWSTGPNWSPSGDPQNGDYLILSLPGAFTTNDIVGLRLDAMHVENGQTILGNPSGNLLVLSNGISCGGASAGGVNEVGLQIELADGAAFESLNGLLLISLPVNLAGHNLSLETDASIWNASTAVINFGGFDGRIYGTGNVRVKNFTATPSLAGDVQFSGNTGANNIDGKVRVEGHTRLTLKKTGFAKSINSRLEIANNAIVECVFDPQFSPSAYILVESGGLLLGGTEQHQMANLEVQGNAVVNSEGGTFIVRTNLFAYGTNGTPVISGYLDFINPVTVNVIGGSSTDLDIPAVVTGAGNITKIGTGTMNLRGTNLFLGTLTVNEGKIRARTASAFGSTNAGTTLDGTNLYVYLEGAAIGKEQLTVNSGTPNLFGYTNSSWAGPIILNSDLNVNSDGLGPLTLSGVISGSGDLIIGTGTVRLSGSSANTFAGTTRVGGIFNGATLELQKSSGDAIVGPLVIGDFVIGGTPQKTVRLLTGTVMGDIPVTIYGDGLLDLNGYNDGVGSLALYDGAVTTGAGTLTLAGDVSAHLGGNTISGNLNLGGTTRTFATDYSTACALTIAAVVSNGGIRKTGDGRLCLTGANTYAGSTIVAEGILEVNNNGALGSTSVGTTVSNGASLVISSNITSISEPLTLNGTGFGNTNGALNLAPSTSIVVGSHTTLGNSSTIRIPAGPTAAMTGVIDGTGSLTKTGSGTLTFGGVNFNTYFGDTIVNGGTLQLGKPNGVASIPSHLVIGSGGALGTGATVRHLAGSSNNIIGSITVNNASLYDLNNQWESFTLPELGGQPPLVLNDGGDVRTGTGRLNLPAGTSVIVEPGINGTSTIDGRLGLESSMALGQNHTFAVNSPISAFGGVPLTIYASLEQISGTVAANVIKTGSGEMRIASSPTNASTYTGQLVVNDGQVTLASSTATGAAGSSVFVNSNAVLAIDGSLAIENEKLTLNSTAPVSLTVLSGASYWNSTITLNRNTTLNVNSGASLDIYFGFSGTGTMTKTGTGTLQMLGSSGSTNTNTVIVAEGILVLNTTPSVQAINGPLIIGDGLGGANADVVRLSRMRQIANSVPVTINSSGLLDLQGHDESFGALSGSGHIDLGSGANFEANYPSATSTFDGVISGTGNFYKDGTGTLSLNGNNSYVGSTIVYAPTPAEGGTLLVNGFQPQSPVIISNGCTLGGIGTVGNITVSSGGTVSPGSSPGILSCSNITFSSGATFFVELNGTTPGTGYDQLNVRGTVTPSQAILSAKLGFQSAVSNSFTIINNDGTDAMGGSPANQIFNGLSDGAMFSVSGIPFRITYSGGDGNDVVLTQLLPVPTLTLRQLSSSSLKLSWPTNYTGFALESNTNLSSNSWTVVIPPPVISGTNYVVTNSTTTLPQCFYRLRSP